MWRRLVASRCEGGWWLAAGGGSWWLVAGRWQLVAGWAVVAFLDLLNWLSLIPTLLSPCWPIWSYGSLFQWIRYSMTTQTFKTQVIWWFLLLYERRPEWCSYQSGNRWHSLSLSANKYHQLLRTLVSLKIICFFLQTFLTNRILSYLSKNLPFSLLKHEV